ncbi:MAG: SusF/SusE family outer membrane protein [Prevotella sp.]|nr:SusF/SusE family outer membrane protein [Prevotella sp.]
MKKIYQLSMLLLAGAFALTACEDDNESNPTLVQPTSFVLNAPAVNGNVDLQRSQTVALTWSQPRPYNDFDAPVVPTYKVQISPTGSFNKEYDANLEDNTGADFFTLDETYNSGENVEINTETIDRKLVQLFLWEDASKVPALLDLAIRVKACIQDAGFREYKEIYSNVVNMKAVPYYIELKPAEPIIWYMVGNCIGNSSWSNGEVGNGLVPMFLVPNEQYDATTGAGLTSFTGYFPEEGQFKFVLTPGDWGSQLNFTNVKNPGSFLGDYDGDNHNIAILEAGYYTIQVDTKTNDITIDKYDGNVKVYDQLCVAGTFNDWSDSEMTPVFTLDGSENHIWKYELNGGDKLKVKVPGSWDTNWGYKSGLAGEADGDGNLVVPEGKYLFLFNDITGDYMLIDLSK